MVKQRKLGSAAKIADPVLVVAAHPDDIEVHCGGMIAQLVAQGKQVVCVLCTSGNRGTGDPEVTMEDIATEREKEQKEALDILGVKDTRFLRHDDGDLLFIMLQLREEIVRLIREIKPRTVITHDPYPGDGSQDSCSIYPDHTAVGLVTFQSAFVCAPSPLFYPGYVKLGLMAHKPDVLYCIMSAHPSLFLDITETWPTKLAAIRKHKSQGRATPESERQMEQINRWNGRRVNVAYAEAFRILLPT